MVVNLLFLLLSFQNRVLSQISFITEGYDRSMLFLELSVSVNQSKAREICQDNFFEGDLASMSNQEEFASATVAMVSLFCSFIRLSLICKPCVVFHFVGMLGLRWDFQ